MFVAGDIATEMRRVATDSNRLIRPDGPAEGDDDGLPELLAPRRTTFMCGQWAEYWPAAVAAVLRKLQRPCGDRLRDCRLSGDRLSGGQAGCSCDCSCQQSVVAEPIVQQVLQGKLVGRGQYSCRSLHGRPPLQTIAQLIANSLQCL